MDKRKIFGGVPPPPLLFLMKMSCFIFLWNCFYFRTAWLYFDQNLGEKKVIFQKSIFANEFQNFVELGAADNVAIFEVDA